METLIDLTTRAEFRVGLVTGGIGALLTLALVAILNHRPLPTWGIFTVVAAWIGVYATIGRRLSLAVGLAILFLAGWIWGRSKTAAMILGLSGGSIVGWRSGLPDVLWIRIAAVVVILVIGVSLLRFDRIEPLSRFAVLMFALTAFGIWATVPDTNEARVLLGVLVFLGITAWPRRLSSLGAGGAFALAGLIVWISSVGGAGRHGSIVGAWASIGLFLAFLGGTESKSDLQPQRVLLLHGIVVFFTSRVAGLQESALVAGAIAIPVLALGLWLLVQLPWLREQSDRSR